MSEKRGKLTKIVRHAVQIACFLLFPGLFIMIFSAIGDLVSAAFSGSFQVDQLYPQLILVCAVLAVTALMGRFFCGYMCSFGMFQELLSFFGKRSSRGKERIPGKVDSKLKLVKYAVLAAVVFTWILQMPVDSSLSPWGVFGVLVSGNFEAIPEALPTIGFALLAAIAVGSVFVERFFCRYLCPLGAVFSGVSRGRLYKVKREQKTCTNCGLCTDACSMGINIPESGSVKSGECIQCMECLPACPKDSLVMSPSGAPAGMIAAAAIGAAMVLSDAVVIPVNGEVYGQQIAEAATTAPGIYQDGIYTGSAKGFRGTTQVQVKVENGYISDITVVSSDDDRQFLQQAQSGIIQQILATQSTDVSAVSGATYSSRGIMDAVSDALSATPSVYVESEPDLPDTSEDTQGDIVWSRPSARPGKLTFDKDRSKTDYSEDAEAAPSAAAEETSAQGAVAVQDGTYEGTGNGFRGSTSVSVTVEGGQITDITVLSYQDDRPYFDRAQSTVISEILASQSVEVQPVSGATYSSNGIMEAVANALGVDFSAASTRGGSRGGHAPSNQESGGSAGSTGHGKGRMRF